MSFKLLLLAPDLDPSWPDKIRQAVPGVDVSSERSSLLTRRWREPDSNHRSRRERDGRRERPRGRPSSSPGTTCA